MTTKNEQVLQIAQRFLGMNEHRNKDVLRKFLGINPASTPWCAAFVNAVLKEAGIKGTGSNLARSFLKWGVETDRAQIGDIVVFTRANSNWQGHVAFYIGMGQGKDGTLYVQTLGGNQSDSVNVQYYKESNLLGVRTYE